MIKPSPYCRRAVITGMLFEQAAVNKMQYFTNK